MDRPPCNKKVPFGIQQSDKEIIPTDALSVYCCCKHMSYHVPTDNDYTNTSQILVQQIQKKLAVEKKWLTGSYFFYKCDQKGLIEVIKCST
jgi:hypothetical protein